MMGLSWTSLVVYDRMTENYGRLVPELQELTYSKSGYIGDASPHSSMFARTRGTQLP
jgi:hypothetical protein